MPRTLQDHETLDGSGALEQYTGYGLCDPEGNRIGKVMEVYANWDHEPEYIRASLGRLGLRSALIPVQSVTVDGERQRLVLE